MPPKAPYIPKGWLQNFLQLIKRVRLTKVDRGIVKQYTLTAAGNESKLVGALRFLKLIDGEGNIDEAKLNSLKMEGETFKAAVNKLVHEAYAEVFQSLDTEKANSMDLKNFFTGTYGYSQMQSTGAAILFAFLCELAEINISSDIQELNKQGVRFSAEKKEKKKNIQKKEKTRDLATSPTQSPHSIPMEVNDNEYFVIIRGKGFSLNKSIKTSEDLDLLIQTLKINCQFKKEE